MPESALRARRPRGRYASVVCAALLVSTGACDRAPPGAEAGGRLILYCGAGVRPAATALIEAFEKRHGVTVSPTYAGSGRLLGQLAASRRGDLFMPGSAFYVDRAIERKLADPATKRTVAYFVPVILVQKGNPLGIASLADLARVKHRLGLGEERAVAIGRRSMQLFEKNGVPVEEIRANLVYSSGTVNELGVAIEMKTVDAAIVWDANARQFAHAGDMIEIPPEQNIVSTIPIAVLTFSRDAEAAKLFAEFAASDAAKAILREQEYTVELQKEDGGR